jgi:Helix-turn-helix domain
MSVQPTDEQAIIPTVEDIATEVANILSRRLEAKDLVRLLQIVFLDVEETAELLRVKSTTVSTWISKGLIPVRYAGGRPVFLLSELLNWTLPENDKHIRHRLTAAQQCKIAVSKLSISRERSND